jgi:GNAT superfamily N-acetyltransferase
MSDFIIRPYQSIDREAIRKIAFDTAFMGEPAEVFFTDQEVLADILTAYFTDHEPESLFVAESEGKVIGYLLGAKDSARIRRFFRSRIMWPLVIKILKRGTMAQGKNIRLGWKYLSSYLQGEFSTPDLYHDYPAVLHINIAAGYRAGGIGAKLIETFLDYLAKAKVPGVQLATISDQAARFFEKQGFILLAKKKHSYFRSILQRDLDYQVFGKRIREQK